MPAIVVGGILLVRMKRNRTGLVSYFVVGLQVANAVVAIVLWIVYQSVKHQNNQTALKVWTIAVIGFYTQSLQNISDFVFATQYLVGSLQLGNHVSANRAGLVCYAFLFVLMVIILGYAFQICLSTRDFLENKGFIEVWEALYCQ